MKDYPIIFSAPMVRALMDGRKTMTRRLAWREPSEEFLEYVSAVSGGIPSRISGKPTIWQKVKPGDQLWVRENWRAREKYDRKPNTGPTPLSTFIYEADAPHAADLEVGRLRSSIHMPRWASRLTLLVTATKIERVQEITPEDAEAEGVFRHIAECSLDKVFRDQRGPQAITYFRELWERLHGPTSWEANPEVVAISFKPHLCNIDHMDRAA
jgi:hypothetical protein